MLDLSRFSLEGDVHDRLAGTSLLALPRVV